MLHGRYAVLSLTISSARDPFGPINVIRAWDVTTGRKTVNDVERFTGSGIPNREPALPLSGLQVNDRGDVAWIAGHGTGDTIFDVRFGARNQPARLLDAATDVVPNSLALSGDYVYWQRAGTPQSAAR